MVIFSESGLDNPIKWLYEKLKKLMKIVSECTHH